MEKLLDQLHITYDRTGFDNEELINIYKAGKGGGIYQDNELMKVRSLLASPKPTLELKPTQKQ